jgi:hypothetical protein
VVFCKLNPERESRTLFRSREYRDAERTPDMFFTSLSKDLLYT